MLAGKTRGKIETMEPICGYAKTRLKLEQTLMEIEACTCMQLDLQMIHEENKEKIQFCREISSLLSSCMLRCAKLEETEKWENNLARKIIKSVCSYVVPGDPTILREYRR